MADWIDDSDTPLFTDLYELTMLQAYWAGDMHEEAAFSLFVRALPRERNYLLACGLDVVLDYLERLRFRPGHLEYLRALDLFPEPFLEWLTDFRFTGDVFALPEGTPVFGEEPILEVVAPISQAQLVETFAINQIHLQTLIASKASRVVRAARGRSVVDFGMRRMHGTDAALKAARACWIAGATGTSNVLAGRIFGLPVVGTMAHSFVQAHDDEEEAFRAFASLYDDTVLLVDTYDTLEGVRKVVGLADRMGDDFDVRAIRLDSGDLAGLARASRDVLDAAGLDDVDIFVSGGLDEHGVARLLDAGAPIDGFGVGTRLGVSADRPSLEMVYKLTEYAGRSRLKLSEEKELLPGRKQLFRRMRAGVYAGDTIARWGEHGVEGEPLLRCVMEQGRRTDDGPEPLDAIRERTAAAVAALPESLRSLEAADEPYPIDLSEGLRRERRRLAERHRSGGASHARSGADPP